MPSLPFLIFRLLIHFPSPSLFLPCRAIQGDRDDHNVVEGSDDESETGGGGGGGGGGSNETILTTATTTVAVEGRKIHTLSEGMNYFSGSSWESLRREGFGGASEDSVGAEGEGGTNGVGGGGWVWVRRAGLLAGLGTLCKEHAITSLAVCAAWDVIRHRKHVRR